MRKLLLSLAGLMAVTGTSFSQTSLFLEEFEGGAGAFTLNTSTQGGQVGLAGDNAWVVNNSYSGGSGTSSCFGLSFTIGNTPTQPAGIANGPTSNYLHILSDDGTANGITNANYAAADGSFCFFAESYFAEMTNDISTVGYTNVTLDFWWACLGSNNEAYGQVFYSVDGGTNWIQLTTPVSQYVGSSSWANQIITNAAWDNQATLRFGFRYNNGVATAGGDPSFSIDDVEIFGTSGGGGSNTITTGTSLTPSSWCQGSTTTMNVDFTSTGTFNGGNVYTAQLSDATGSFAAPTAVGTLTSTANSGTITAVIPGATPAGTGYRIRVVSDNPATIGSDNGSNLVINAAPDVNSVNNQVLCEGAQTTAVNFSGSVGGTSFSWTNSNATIGLVASGNGNIAPFTGLNSGSTPNVGTITVTPSANGCSGPTTQFTITVNPTPTVTQQPFSDVCEGGGAVNLVGATPGGGTYSGTGVSGTSFDPALAGQGTTNITYTFTDGNGCTGSATEPITVLASPTVTLNPFADVCDDDPFFTLTGGTPSNGTYTGPGVTGGVFDPSAAGAGTHTITYSFTDGNGCTGTANETITVNTCGSLNESSMVSFQLQPNPASNNFTVVTNSEMESLVLLDMSGREVKSFNPSQQIHDVKEIPSGVYFVRVSVNGVISQQRLVVQ